MDDRRVCTPLLAESDAQNNTTSTPNAASVTDADKVINTKIDSTQVEGDQKEEELLKELLTDDYCHVCEAVLLFESQRLSHYEGKKHAQKLKVYLQAKRSEKMNKEFTGLQRTMTTDKDHFCELCNMVFSSHVVAKSHYEGKVHAKNLRKQGLQPPVIDRYTEVRELDDADQISASESGMEHLLDPAATATTPSTELDLKDPNKCCSLCAASFNNPQMALQHYNGRKHQRKQARQELLKELGDNVQQANSLMCQMCGVQFNSVEMYQAHMQGNKHQIREKKVVDLCKSQQKDYNTFADELADYIQVQKARGITSKAGQVLPLGNTQKEGEEDEEEEAFNEGDDIELNTHLPNRPPTSNPLHPSRPGCYYPAAEWRPPYQGPPWPPYDWDYNRPPRVLQGSGTPLFTSQPTKKRRRRKQSSSSSYTSSSYSSSSSSSSYSSSTSDSDDSEHRRREKRRTRRSRRERDRRTRDEDPDKEEKRRKRQRNERENNSEERRREESGESEEERRRRKKQKHHGKRRRREKKSELGERVMDDLRTEDMDSRKETEVHFQAEMNVEQGEGGQDEPAKPKYRKDKKKTKEKVDTRTEEEKLWDDSILGC